MLGKMNKKATIVRFVSIKDEEGFTEEAEEIVAEIRCYKEGRHGSEHWANLASFSNATDLFQFRKIPGVEITTEMFIIFEGDKFNILSVEDVKGKGMYIEVLAEKVNSSYGKM